MNLQPAPAANVDLTSCDREPIHIPSAIQPHGALLVFDGADGAITQFSANTPALLGITELSNAANVLERNVLAVIEGLASGKTLDIQPHFLGEIRLSGSEMLWSGTVHRTQGLFVLEFQPATRETDAADATPSALRRTITELDTCRTVASFCQAAAEHFRTLTGFDRSLIYKFMPDGSGEVIAEAKRDGLEPYLGLRYPASDIPAQARQLYIRNPFRLTVDVNQKPVPVLPTLNPQTSAPLDMSLCALRATSPVHLEYLRNMGVCASLSFSILHEEKLWGLVACHHMSPRAISQQTRISGEILARLVSLQVGAQEETEQRDYVLRLDDTRAALSERLRATGDFAQALVIGEPNLLTNIRASGVALCTGSRILSLGQTPDQFHLEAMCNWLQKRPWQPIWSTDELSAHYEPASHFLDKASGVLALRLAQNSPEAVVWFRPELVEHVRWAGDPRKAVQPDGASGSLRLHPRRSFEAWRQEVRAKSASWQNAELEFASELRDSMSSALLEHRAVEITRLNNELLRSNRELEQFASIASHDLQEPLRTVTSYTQLLLRRSELKNDENAKAMGAFIVDAVARMSALIANLLQFAQAGKQQHNISPVQSGNAVRGALENLQSLVEEKNAIVQYGELPLVCAHEEQLTRVFQNLIANAIKYSRPGVHPVVSIDAERRGTNWLFQIRDNGLGFNPDQADAIFESFSRLHARQVAGTGLGLAICRKIIQSFGGNIWAESDPNTGSTFYLTLPAVRT